MWFKNKETEFEFFITDEEHQRLLSNNPELFEVIEKEETPKAAPKKKGAK